jgi:hypothetical protein
MPRVIIIGFGKMGRIHAKHLAELGVAWDYFDPFVDGGVRRIENQTYTHAIISTPIASHFQSYRELEGFPGPILIEKPVVVCEEHFGILDDPRVVPGMVERFNPAVAALKSLMGRPPAMTMTFHRTSLTGDVADIGIHDLDLFTHLAQNAEPCGLEWDGETFVIHARNVEARFNWRKSTVRQTLVECSTLSGHFAADLYAQKIDGIELPHRWPIKAELQAFLAGNSVDAKRSHRLLIDCLRLRCEAQEHNLHAVAHGDLD